VGSACFASSLEWPVVLDGAMIVAIQCSMFYVLCRKAGCLTCFALCAGDTHTQRWRQAKRGKNKKVERNRKAGGQNSTQRCGLELRTQLPVRHANPATNEEKEKTKNKKNEKRTKTNATHQPHAQRHGVARSPEASAWPPPRSPSYAPCPLQQASPPSLPALLLLLPFT